MAAIKTTNSISPMPLVNQSVRCRMAALDGCSDKEATVCKPELKNMPAMANKIPVRSVIFATETSFFLVNNLPKAREWVETAEVGHQRV
jgi:hypothetical protein